MKLKALTFLTIIFCLSIQTIRSQEYSISGKLIDSNDAIIPAASIILLNKMDSSFVQGTISDNNGSFAMSHILTGDYALSIQHLLYQNKEMNVSVHQSLNIGNVKLESNARELDEVSVKATRPLVKMENNTLIYNTAVISDQFVRNNALELLGDVPGILLQGEKVQLIGASQLNFAINGKPTTLTYDQIIAMLKSMPHENIKEIQVMYAPPAKYNVKGALINIVLNKSARNQYNGSVDVGFCKKSDAGYNGGVNLQTSTAKWNLNFMYSSDYDRTNKKYQIDIDHTYQDTLYQIRQNMNLPDKTFDQHFQFTTDYDVDSLNTISFSYLGNHTNHTQGTNDIYSTFSSENNYYTESDTTKSVSTETMHNLKLEYSIKDKLQAGVDYTYYTGPSKDGYKSVVDDETIVYRTKSKQTVNKWMAYINHTINIVNTSVNYGINYQYSGNNNYSHYYSYENVFILDETQSTNNKFQETELSGFISFQKQLNKKLSIDFSIKGENSTMRKDTLNTHINLWNTFKVYPKLNLSYHFDEQYNHMLQFSVQSAANYPSYWEISPATSYTNLYMLVKGTPGLKPSQTYEAGIHYILKRKYMAILSYTYIDGMITQIPYASTESFNTIAQNQNIDFSSNLTAALVIPFQLSDFVNVNPTLVYQRRRMKNSSSENESFNRTSNTFNFQLNSSISLVKKIGLKAELSGFCQNGMIQGIYNIEPIYSVSCGLSCNMLKDKAVINVKMDDIFNSRSPETHINFGNQKSHYQFDNDTRMLQVTFRYNFGKPFKAKKIDVDQSRFKRLQ